MTAHNLPPRLAQHLAYVERRALEEKARQEEHGQPWSFEDSEAFATSFYPKDEHAALAICRGGQGFDLPLFAVNGQPAVPVDEYVLSVPEQNVRQMVRARVHSVRRDPHTGWRAVVFAISNHRIVQDRVQHPDSLPYLTPAAGTL